MTSNIQDPFVRPPVPRMPIQGKEDSLSKVLRKCNNTTLTTADDMGVYITTNETGLAAAHTILANTPKISGGCAFGFSGLHNLDIIAARQSSLAIICDRNPENAFLFQNILEIVKKNANRMVFTEHAANYVQDVAREPKVVENMRAMKSGSKSFVDLTHSVEIPPNLSDDPSYQNFSPQDQIRSELKKVVSWLYSDGSYLWIRKLALEDKIVVITEDIRSTQTFERIRGILQSNNIQMDSLYVSNIHEYMKTEEDQKSFLKTINALSENDTLIITTAAKLVQKVGQPKALPDMKKWFFSSMEHRADHTTNRPVQPIAKLRPQAPTCIKVVQYCMCLFAILVVAQYTYRQLPV